MFLIVFCRRNLLLCASELHQIKSNRIYLQAQNITENAGDKQQVEQWKQQIQTGVLARLNHRETALT